MAKSKDDIKYAVGEARLSEDEGVRVGYKHGTPLEGGKIADSSPVDLFSSAHNINSHSQSQSQSESAQSQSTRPPDPDDHHYDFGVYTKLLDMEGRLCISHGNVIWVMEEYGVKESWSKTYINDMDPICFAKTIDVALVTGFDEQVKKSWFVESLISLETEKVEEVEVV
ncbi:hypothetical protein COLO4_04148 [Corchorus olitorius]|uniref:F-box associated domain-containing protein n=1 Tax=Corchorus olitorius TaxID=93759 RepID=A0A1R3KV41_9ROSI|nr:hypothetical protein COLO4_04148 [Corchorus olitorius]